MFSCYRNWVGEIELYFYAGPPFDKTGPVITRFVLFKANYKNSIRSFALAFFASQNAFAQDRFVSVRVFAVLSEKMAIY